MNVKLLKQVRDYIAKHPEKYNQSSWCGTACCVAGTTMFVAGEMSRKDLASSEADALLVLRGATKLLELSGDQSLVLFSASWAGVADGQFLVSSTMDPVLRSQKAVKRINHFIKTKGAE